MKLKKLKKNLKIKPINFCGKFDLQESLYAMKKTNLVVGIDSGNLHMAASARTRVIGLYGPMNEKKWGAYPCKSGTNIILTAEKLSCRPCGLSKKCKNNYACLKNITVEQVKNAINTVI